MNILFAIFLTLLTYTNAIPSLLTSLNNRTILNYDILRRDDADEPDLEDQSWIKSFSALGDSYAAGIGAGNVLGGNGDSGCSRTDGSYPYQINDDYRMGDGDRAFTFRACSGALANDVINQQLPSLPGNQDLITMSIGGNDLGLVDILNGCIYQWNPFKDCQKALDNAQQVVNSDDFSNKISQIVATTKGKLSTNGMVYWTGYGHFFGTDDTQCDSVTWSFWYNFGNKEYLKLDRRKTMNSLVDQVNSKISDIIKSNGDGKVVFIDYSPYYDNLISRFCEAGWPEEDPNRAGLAFFEWDSNPDADVDNLNPRQATPEDSVLLNGTVSAMINEDIMEALQQDPSLKTNQTSLDYSALATVSNRTTLASNTTNFSAQNVTRRFRKAKRDVPEGYQLSVIPIPDSIGRVFHPNTYGYAIIRNMIFYEMAVANAQRANEQAPAMEFDPDTCTYNPPARQTCNNNSASSVPSQMVGADDKTLSPNDLMFALREVICNDKCEQPAGIPSDVAWAKGSNSTDGADCEIAVAIQGGIEAYLYRGTHAQGDQWQQCWDETASIINQCVQNGPNEGWINGPNDYQFYQGGFRPLNGPGSKHSPITGQGLKSVASGGIVGPGKFPGVTCGNDASVGVNVNNDCLSLINGLVGAGLDGGGFLLNDGNTTKGICTDSSFCVSKGDSKKSDGSEVLGSYCEVISSNSCSFVLATKASTYGFPGKSCISPADVNQAIRDMTHANCQGDDAWAAEYKSDDLSANYPYTAMALVSSDAAGSVYA